jgi:prolyl 4-hydroxylase
MGKQQQKAKGPDNVAGKAGAAKGSDGSSTGPLLMFGAVAVLAVVAQCAMSGSGGSAPAVAEAPSTAADAAATTSLQPSSSVAADARRLSPAEAQSPGTKLPGCGPPGLTVTVFENGRHDGGVPTCITDRNMSLAELTALLRKPIQAGLDKEASFQPTGYILMDHIGQRFHASQDLEDGQRVHVLRNDRQWMWPSHAVGTKVYIDDPVIKAPSGRLVEIETINSSPRVFMVNNFIDPEEADALRDYVLQINDPELKLKRSGVGADGGDESGFGETSSVRTSENAFDSTSPTAQALIKRAFALLRIPYDKNLEDGLQIVHYSAGKAYIPHHDYFPVLEPGQTLEHAHNFDAQNKGSNRFATVFLYISDVDEGGQTVFPSLESDFCRDKTHNCTKPGEKEFVNIKTGISFDEEASYQGKPSPERKTNQTWEASMIHQCYSRLAVKPKKGSAALFYSQHPNGVLDHFSLHGGCPVISGDKWGANLWVWNGPRYGMTHVIDPETSFVADGFNYVAPDPTEAQAAAMAKGPPGSVHLKFVNRLPHRVKAFFFMQLEAGDDRESELQHFGDVDANGGQLGTNTFQGHGWAIQTEDGKLLKTMITDLAKGKSQQMVIE